MKKSLPIILVVLVVGGVGAYLFMNQSGQEMMPKTPSQQQGQQEEKDMDTDQEAEKENYSGNLMKMINLGVPLKCTFSQGDRYSGTMWVKGKNFYNEVTSEEQIGRIIYKDDCMWSWAEGQEKGIKMCFDPDEANDVFSGEAETGQTNLPTDVEFDCRPAVFTDAKFSVPSGVEFMDMDEMMQQFSQ
jgi:uncharacterized protein YxeA